MIPRPSLVVLLALTVASCSGPPSDPRCPDGTTPRCAPDGMGTVACSPETGFDVRSDCPTSEVCDAGSCKPVVCTAGLAFCDRGFSDTCSASGTVEQRVDCGRLGEVCVEDAMGARCTRLACSPGTRSCSPDGTQVLKCDPDGLATELAETCDDPGQRGNGCKNGVCIDRCQSVEAGSRSTLGCRFVAAALAVGPSLALLIANPQPDLPATISINGAASKIIAAGQTGVVPTSATAIEGTSLGAALAITSSVPVFAWQLADAALGPNGDGAALLPVPSLGTLHYIAVDGAGGDELIAMAAPKATTVRISPTTSTRAGAGIAAGSAGITMQRDLAAGDLLILVADSPDLSGTRIEATSAIAVFSGTRGKASHTEAPVLPWSVLGKLHDAPPGRVTVVAREDATHVTTLGGTVALGAGGVLHFTGPVRIASDHPVVVTVADLGLAAVAPEEQWLPASTIALPCACSVIVTAHDAAFTVDGKPLTGALVGGAFAWISVGPLPLGMHGVAGSRALLYASDSASPLALTGPFALDPINP